MKRTITSLVALLMILVTIDEMDLAYASTSWISGSWSTDVVLDTAISEEQGAGESDEPEEGEEVGEAEEVETEYHDGVYVTYVIYSDPIRISDLYDIQTTGTPTPPDTEVIIDSTDSTASLVDDIGDEEKFRASEYCGCRYMEPMYLCRTRGT